MKTRLFLTACALMIAGTTPAQAAPASLEDLLKEIKVALLKVKTSSQATKLPPLESATLNAVTTQQRVTGAKIKLLVIEFGKKRTSELTTTVSIKLVPPDSSNKNVGNDTVADALANAILAASESIEAARAGPTPLDTEEVTVKLKFGVSDDGNGNLKVEFAPLTAEIGGSTGLDTSQEIVVVYKKPGK